VNVINKEACRLLINNQSLDEINKTDIFINNKNANIANQLYNQISLLTLKTTIIISLTPTNHFYLIFLILFSNNALIGILLIYILVIEKGEILN